MPSNRFALSSSLPPAQEQSTTMFWGVDRYHSWIPLWSLVAAGLCLTTVSYQTPMRKESTMISLTSFSRKDRVVCSCNNRKKVLVRNYNNPMNRANLKRQWQSLIYLHEHMDLAGWHSLLHMDTSHQTVPKMRQHCRSTSKATNGVQVPEERERRTWQRHFDQFPQQWEDDRHSTDWDPQLVIRGLIERSRSNSTFSADVWASSSFPFSSRELFPWPDHAEPFQSLNQLNGTTITGSVCPPPAVTPPADQWGSFVSLPTCKWQLDSQEERRRPSYDYIIGTHG